MYTIPNYFLRLGPGALRALKKSCEPQKPDKRFYRWISFTRIEVRTLYLLSRESVTAPGSGISQGYLAPGIPGVLWGVGLPGGRDS